MTTTPNTELTKESLFMRVQHLEDLAFEMMGDSTQQQRYHAIMNEVDSLSEIAREKGWIQ